MNEQQNLLSEQTCAAIDKWLAKYPADKKQSAIIPALHIVQKANGGWLSTQAIDAVADYLGMPHIAAYEVATFYSMFELKETGKHKLCVCTNISCMLSGSNEIVEHLKKRLDIGLGETTADGQFTLKEVECLGACVHAPVIHYNEEYHRNLTPQKLDEIIDGAK